MKQSGARLLLGAAAVALLLAGLSAWLLARGARDGTADESAAAATQPSSPTRAPASPPPEPVVSKVSVRWEPAGRLPLFEGARELQEPFAREWEGRGQRRPGLQEKAGWGVWLVRGPGDPELLIDSPRWLPLRSVAYGLVDGLDAGGWTSNASFQVPAITKFAGRSPFDGSEFVYMATGSMTFDLARASVAVTSSLTPFPDQPSVGSPELYGPPSDLRYSREPGGDRYLVWRVQGGANTTGPVRDVYVTEASGDARRLDGLPSLARVAWAPGGSYVVGATSAGGPATLYFILVEEGTTTVVPGATSWRLEKASDGARRNGSRVIYAADNTVGVFDSADGSNRLVAKLPVTSYITWGASPDSAVIGRTSIDLRSGEVTALPTPSPFVPQPLPPSISPDGRYAVEQGRPGSAGNAASCDGVPSSLAVREVASGRTDTLLECEGGISGRIDWISATELLLTVGNCDGCDGWASARLYLIDVETRAIHSLTDGLEPLFSAKIAYLSPDGSRILVASGHVRVYRRDGSLLRDYGPMPTGYVVTFAAWSPDGSSFFFVLGPHRWFPYGL